MFVENGHYRLRCRTRRLGYSKSISADGLFSVKYANRGDLFEGLAIWQEEEYQKLQGTYPVISLSFARVKEINFENTKQRLQEIIAGVFEGYLFLKEGDALSAEEKEYFDRILLKTANEVETTSSLHQLSKLLCSKDW